jgi:hypothetical protein
MTATIKRTLAYAWIITRDYYSDHSWGCASNKGLFGPASLSFEEMKQIESNSKGCPFRMRDDDGELYFEGLLYGEHTTGFEPLEDFGMPDSGCTTIEYVNGQGHWEAL